MEETELKQHVKFFKIIMYPLAFLVAIFILKNTVLANDDNETVDYNGTLYIKYTSTRSDLSNNSSYIKIEYNYINVPKEYSVILGYAKSNIEQKNVYSGDIGKNIIFCFGLYNGNKIITDYGSCSIYQANRYTNGSINYYCSADVNYTDIGITYGQWDYKGSNIMYDNGMPIVNYYGEPTGMILNYEYYYKAVGNGVYNYNSTASKNYDYDLSYFNIEQVGVKGNNYPYETLLSTDLIQISDYYNNGNRFYSDVAVEDPNRQFFSNLYFNVQEGKEQYNDINKYFLEIWISYKDEFIYLNDYPINDLPGSTQNDKYSYSTHQYYSILPNWIDKTYYTNVGYIEVLYRLRYTNGNINLASNYVINYVETQGITFGYIGKYIGEIPTNVVPKEDIGKGTIMGVGPTPEITDDVIFGDFDVDNFVKNSGGLGGLADGLSTTMSFIPSWVWTMFKYFLAACVTICLLKIILT